MADTKIVARPWQPQDLIDDLQGIIDEECDNYLNTRRTTLCMARDYLKEYFAEQKWIPVTERLPENRESVLCSYCGMFGQVTKIVGFANCLEDVHEYDFNGHKGGGFYSYDSEYGYYEIEDVTHWMPLPEAPKGE